MEELINLDVAIKFVSAGNGGGGGAVSAASTATSGVATGDISMLIFGIVLTLVGAFAAWGTIAYKKHVFVGAHTTSSKKITLPIVAAFLTVLLGLTLAVSGTNSIKAHADEGKLSCNDIIATVDENTGDISFAPASLQNNTERDFSFIGFSLKSVDGIDINNIVWTVKLDDTTIYSGKADDTFTFQDFQILASGSSHEISVSQSGLTTDYAKTLIDKSVATMSFENAKSSVVTLDANGGTAGTTTSVPVWYNFAMPEIESSALPTREGYIFDGYFDAITGGEQYYKADGTSAKNWDKWEDTTLYAHWTAKTVTVNFDLNYQTEMKISSIDQTFDTNYRLPSDPQRESYTFLGWFTEEESGTQVTTETIVKNPNNHTLYAHWKASTYTIEFSIYSGSGSLSETKIENIEAGTEYYVRDYMFFIGGEMIIATPAKGYDFSGWSKMEEVFPEILMPGIKYKVTGNTQIYASFELEEFTITVQPNDSTMGDVSPTTVNVTYGSTFLYDTDGTLFAGCNLSTWSGTPLLAQNKEGYDFVNWTINYEEVKNGQVITGPYILVANFKEKEECTVTFSVDEEYPGGTIDQESLKVPKGTGAYWDNEDPGSDDCIIYFYVDGKWINVSIKPDDGKCVSQILQDGQNIEKDEDFHINSDSEIVVRFAQQFTITSTEDPVLTAHIDDSKGDNLKTTTEEKLGPVSTLINNLVEEFIQEDHISKINKDIESENVLNEDSTSVNDEPVIDEQSSN